MIMLWNQSTIKFMRIRKQSLCLMSKNCLIYIVGFLLILYHRFVQEQYLGKITPDVGLSLGFNNKFLYGISLMDERICQGRFHFEISFEIQNCFFSRLTEYSQNGGVIFVCNGSYTMNVTDSMFYNCSSSGQGGAIFFNSTNSNIQRLCAHKCSAARGHFADLQASGENYVDFLSVSFCSQVGSGYYPVHLITGKQRVENTNSSMNDIFSGSGIRFYSPSSLMSSYCTYSNNKAIEGICIYFWSCSGTLSSVNIVHNNSPTYGVVYSNSGAPILTYCIFDLNQNTLFYVASGSLEVCNSFLNFSGLLSTSVAVSIANNNSLSKKHTYILGFFNSYYCNTDIPLKTIEGTIGATPKETVQRTYEDCSVYFHSSDLNELKHIFTIQSLAKVLVLMIV